MAEQKSWPEPSPPAATVPPAADDARVTRALQSDLLRAHFARTGQVMAVGLAAGALVLVVLGLDGVRPRLGWWLALAVTLGVRTAIGRAGRRQAEPDAATWLTRLRAMAVLHGAVWGALAWVGPPPTDVQAAGALAVLLAGVAIGGMLMSLSDRWAATGFGFAVALPLVLRLVTLPPDMAQLALATVGLLVLVMATLWVVGRRTARERRALVAARLAHDEQSAQREQTEALLQRVFEHVGEGICVFDAGWRLQAANTRIVELLGLDPALAARGTPLEAWVRQLAGAGEYGDVDVEAEVARRLANVQRGVRGVAQRRRRDGRVIETRRTPLPEGGFAMVCVDITERVASEDALFENRRTLELLLQNTEEGFWFIDNQHRTTDANPAMCRLLGVRLETLIGRTIWEFVDAENEAVFREQVARRARGLANTYEITLTRADGERVVCVNNATPIQDADGHKIGAIGLFSDVTAERRAAAAARQAMALAAEKSHVLEVTLDSLAQGVLGFDAAHRLHSWNRRARELLELPPELLARRPTLGEIGRWQQAHGVFGDDLERIDDEAMRQAVRRHLEDKSTAGEELMAYRRRRADGRVIEVRTHVGTDGGQVRTYTDVTAEEQASQALMAAKDDAERANRAKSEFLSRMSHELRTPLNAILGFGQLMDRDTGEPLGPAQRERMRQILHGGQHLLTLINEVLDLARIETGTLSLSCVPVDVDGLADESLRLVEPMARARPVRLAPREGRAGHVLADPTRLRQVLLNLLANAIKYNRPDGEVRLRCRVEAGRVRIEVDDLGAGLDEDQQQRLFRPFERLEADRDAIEGTGIGLALSRSLVELMGGRIGVRSVVGEGSTFWVELPAAAGADARPALPAALAAARPAAGVCRRVLYIEDNAVNQMVMQGMLSHRPQVELMLADTPERGLAMAAEEPPDLVLLDIQLPGASGYDVLRALREDPRTRDVPAVAVSANAMPVDLARAREAGFDGYLTKPLDLPDLLATVDRWLAAGGRR